MSSQTVKILLSWASMNRGKKGCNWSIDFEGKVRMGQVARMIEVTDDRHCRS